jgi:hypothetical protein
MYTQHAHCKYPWAVSLIVRNPHRQLNRQRFTKQRQVSSRANGFSLPCVFWDSGLFPAILNQQVDAQTFLFGARELTRAVKIARLA